MNQTSERIKTGDVSLHVTQAGSGPPVLLLHGFPDSHLVWREQIPALAAAGFRVIAPDLRGFGESDAPVGKENYGISTLVADLLNLLDALEINGKVRLVGHDWGAALGWDFVYRHSERIDRFAALSVGHLAAFRAAGIRQKLKSWYMLAFQVPGLAEKVFPACDWLAVRKTPGPASEVARWIADLSRPGRLTAGINYYRANLHHWLTSDFPRVRIPVMGMWSPGDIALTERQMTGSQAWMDAEWRYHRIENASHWLQLDQPAIVNRLLIEWLSGESADQAASASAT